MFVLKNYVYIKYILAPEASDVCYAIYNDSDETTIKLLNSCSNLTEHVPPLSETPFHCAVKAQGMSAIKHLIECDVNPNEVDRNGDTPLHIACRYGFTEVY